MNFQLLVVFLISLKLSATVANPNVEQINQNETRNMLGEGPHWDIERQSLYYIDILDSAIFRYDHVGNKIYKAKVDGELTTPISFMIPVESTTDEFIIGAGLRLLLIKWDGVSSMATTIKSLGEVDLGTENRFNDAKVDPNGVLFCGTMGSEEKFDLFKNHLGSLYRFSVSTGFIEIKTNIGISNGLAWNESLKKFYYIDSVALDIKEFDWNPETGNVSNEHILLNLKDKYDNITFVADGMTIDTEGNLYVATFFGSRVLKINPKTKKIEMEISIPTPQVTSVAFGGENLDILFVTTAGKPAPQVAPAGGLFKITDLGAKGKPMNKFKLYA